MEAGHDDQWAEIIASHYNSQLRRWYMTTARHQRESIVVLTGADLIRLGYPEC